jgi:hypothetical protein
MRPLLAVVVLVAACTRNAPRTTDSTQALGVPPLGSSADTAAVLVTQPTLLVFSPNVSQAQVDSSEELSTVFDDLNHHLAAATNSLQKLGFRIVERTGRSFVVGAGAERREITVAADSADVGYVFLAPDRHDRVYYGVMVDVDLIASAYDFLKRSRSSTSRPPE